MGNAFLIKNDENKEIEIEKLHVNIWLFNKKTIYQEIGLMLKMKKELLINESSLTFSLSAPFAIKNNYKVDLYENLKKDEILRLLFNDEIKETQNIDQSTEHVICNKIFRSGVCFLLIKPKLNILENKKEITIKLDLEKIDSEKSELFFSGKEVLYVYVRFRLEIDVEKSDNIYIAEKFLNQKILFDLRFNELRRFDYYALNKYKKLLPIKTIQIFLIQPVSFRVRLEDTKEIKYVRFLEENDMWREYIEKLKKRKEKFVIYYWKESPRNSASFDVLIPTETEKDELQRQLNLSSLFALFAFLFFIIPENQRIISEVEKLIPRIGVYFKGMSLFFLVLVFFVFLFGIISSFFKKLYAVLK
ncbi:MAG: hypothetical protein QY316_01735 [Thermodesulfobacteriota bacterium]|nr:MAG: hypothetical protein QY316_01735 [Thermodesulfobacteriota bacterium]